MKEPKKRLITWTALEKLVRELAKQVRRGIKSGVEYKYITGIPRGGLIPAVMLSHQLVIPYRELTLIANDPLISPESVLMVDDISDTGETIRRFIEAGYTLATLHVRRGTNSIPSIFVEEIVDNTWIVYPFEKEESEPIQDYKKQLLKG